MRETGERGHWLGRPKERKKIEEKGETVLRNREKIREKRERKERKRKKEKKVEREKVGHMSCV